MEQKIKIGKTCLATNNSLEYEKVLTIIKQKRISKSMLSELTNIPKRTIYHILSNSGNYNKTAYENIIKINLILNNYSKRNN